ncbi:hypothetical protein AFR_27680 [Actinoplanes friuliensis DSM 7358]|uniref:Peptidoglycan binding-like domain-containing protein n=1 Tax=Actinoplanes friuliensis DSM 7358 TaxID=1246995 RepID=U5W448_9ACTN|nr:hypothetical protein AFR_27680 [Actinoplanes friuliensis DSM 7358]
MLVLAGLVVAGLRFLPERKPTGTEEATGPPAATAVVTRTDLSTTRTVSGELGYGTPQELEGGAGTVTWLPKQGAVVKRGQPVYRRDDRPVPLFYGRTPLFRPLDRAGLVGRDVRVVVDNLRALGYRTGDQPLPGSPAEPAPLKVHAGDGVMTRSLIAAVKRWQTDHGVPATGVIAPGDVLVHSGKLRVAALIARPGRPSDAPLMAVTGTAKVVTVQLDAGDSGSVRRGDAVRVTLPDGDVAKAKVTSVGTTARAPEGGDGTEQPRTTVTVKLDDSGAVSRLTAAPVQVEVTGETRPDVLAVPVGALLALLEGGYAVQIAGGALVPVDTGLFADGRVEVSGPGLDEGVTVVTAS